MPLIVSQSVSKWCLEANSHKFLSSDAARSFPRRAQRQWRGGLWSMRRRRRRRRESEGETQSCVKVWRHAAKHQFTLWQRGEKRGMRIAEDGEEEETSSEVVFYPSFDWMHWLLPLTHLVLSLFSAVQEPKCNAMWEEWEKNGEIGSEGKMKTSFMTNAKEKHNLRDKRAKGER